MSRTITSKITLIAVTAAIAGALAALFAIAFTNPASSDAQGRLARQHHARMFVRHHRALLRAVHGEAVVPIKNGTDFATVTFDRGKVKDLSGNDLTITEGTAKATYRDVTITIPAGAKVRLNGHKAALSDLKAGMKVAVLQGVKNTFVVARHHR